MDEKTINTMSLAERIDYGVRRGAARALARHKKNGVPIAVWKDGKVVQIQPQDIVIPEEFKDIVDEKETGSSCFYLPHDLIDSGQKDVF